MGQGGICAIILRDDPFFDAAGHKSAGTAAGGGRRPFADGLRRRGARPDGAGVYAGAGADGYPDSHPNANPDSAPADGYALANAYAPDPGYRCAARPPAGGVALPRIRGLLRRF